MATLDLNKSLDDLITEKKSAGGRGRSGGKGRPTGKGMAGRGGSKGRKGGGGFSGRQAGGFGGGMRNSWFSSFNNFQRSTPYGRFMGSAGRGRGRGGAPAGGPGQDRLRVYVTGLPYDWEENDILHVFETAGAVDKLTIFWDPSGRPTGAALVAYRNQSGAANAVNVLDGARLADKEIAVSYARDNVTNRRAGGAPAAGGRAGGAGAAGWGGKGAKGGKSSFNAGFEAGLAAARKGSGGGRGRSFGKGVAGRGAGRGRGRGRGGRGGQIERAVAPSKEDLDRELEKFLQESS